MMVFADRLAGFIGAPWATSFCNLHELWLTELTV
jgi:desulfoferrodoxin (superoxide reductase-like protein)